MTAQAHITLNFSTESADVSESISISLHDEMNTDGDGNTKTAFIFGEIAYLKVITSPEESAYSMSTTWGTLTKTLTGETFSVAETLTFANANSASLTNPVKSIKSFEWVGKSPGVTPVFDGRDATLSKKSNGVLNVEYETSGDVWGLKVTESQSGFGGPDEEPMPSLVVGVMGDKAASQIVTFSDGETYAPEEYEAIVKWDCDDEAVSYATVILDGVTYTTGSDGICQLGELTPEKSYQIYAEKEGTSATFRFTAPAPDAE